MRNKNQIAQTFGSGTQQSFGFLKNYQLTPKDDRKLFKFQNPGDRFFAKLIGRRTATTKLQESARISDVDIVESYSMNAQGIGEAGSVGAYSVFVWVNARAGRSGNRARRLFHRAADFYFPENSFQKICRGESLCGFSWRLKQLI